MRRSRIAIGLIVLIGAVVLGYGWVAFFGWHRPYVNWAPWDLADYLAKNQRPVEECLDLVWFEIMSPTSAEQKALCIHEYAKLTQDPAACELLLPSEYGLSCINNVIAQEYKDHPDSGFFEFSECAKVQNEPLRQDWCQFVRAHKSHRATDCISIKNDVIRSGCTLKFETWERYPDLRGSFSFGQSASQ
jgi:hypothetical protein